MIKNFSALKLLTKFKMLAARQKDYAVYLAAFHTAFGPFTRPVYIAIGLGWLAWGLFDFIKIMPEEINVLFRATHERLDRLEKLLLDRKEQV